MILDGHIHISASDGTRENFIEHLDAAGVDGGMVFSRAPKSVRLSGGATSPAESLDHLFHYADPARHIYPVFFLDPFVPDAVDHVRLAVDRGVYGFKIICPHNDPCEPAAMKVYEEIAAAQKPIFFHSGILYSDTPSSAHHQPILFEQLMTVKKLRFSLAHVSWPWHNECVALYGHFFNYGYRHRDIAAEMFIDSTPGAPNALRHDALSRVYAHPYVRQNVFWGTDGHADNYNVENARESIGLNKEVLDSLELDQEDKENFFSGNLLRFIGVTK